MIDDVASAGEAVQPRAGEPELAEARRRRLRVLDVVDDRELVVQERRDGLDDEEFGDFEEDKDLDEDFDDELDEDELDEEDLDDIDEYDELDDEFDDDEDEEFRTKKGPRRDWE